ncbi:hypothetical protein BVY04_03435 [bacterium M21]|nr:hypothetical protein BVY04_03435 [bacterium M21]
MVIKDPTNDHVIAARAVEARSHLSRMRGMLGRRFENFDAMVFHKNNSIHMFFMRIPLDILFLDKESRVLSLRHSIRPWRMAMHFGAATTIELPAGVLKEKGVTPGDQLEITCDQVL